MLSIEESYRSFWLKGLYNVRGKPKLGVALWLLQKKYIFASVAGPADFTLNVLDPSGLVEAFASEVTRMSTVAFETYIGLAGIERLPKSSGWILIRSYYGAFFAAHALLRLGGSICFQIEAAQKCALDRVADAQSLLPSPNGFEGGFYYGSIDRETGYFRLVKSSSEKKGSHEIVWDHFNKTLRRQADYLLAQGQIYTDAAMLLTDIAQDLCRSGKNAGNWLSYIRNAVNYRHEFGVWFPYGNASVNASDLLRVTDQWPGHPSSVVFRSVANDVSRHVALCTAIVSLCSTVVDDMHQEAKGRRSFHSYGAIALKNLARKVA
jgi:hypothetical protein